MFVGGSTPPTGIEICHVVFPMKTLSVTITSEQKDFLRQKKEDGVITNWSQFIRELLDTYINGRMITDDNIGNMITVKETKEMKISTSKPTKQSKDDTALQKQLLESDAFKKRREKHKKMSNGGDDGI